MKLIGADYLLLLLYLNDKEAINGSVRLIKMMFLFEKQIVPLFKKKGVEFGSLPDYFAYNYGPFSKDVYQQIDLFKSINFVEADNVSSNEEMANADDIVENEFIDECFEGDVEIKSGYNYWVYRITEMGSNYVESEILPYIDEQHKSILEQFKKRITDISIKKLLYYVYTNYPEYTDKSLIKGEVLKNGL